MEEGVSMDGLIVGLDLCDAYTQMVCGQGEKSWTLPTVVCKKKDEDLWLVGEAAYASALAGDGVIVDKLVKLVKKDGTATIGGIKYGGMQLLSHFLQKVLELAREEYGTEMIKRLVISVARVDQRLLTCLQGCGEYLGGSQILLEEGEKMSIDDLLKGITIASGNDAVVAMAETIGGSEANFVTMMNKKANELGLKDTHFQNSHGLDEENHYSSAYDMAMIARELVKHEKILEYSSIYETYLRTGTDRQTWLVNTNKLVRFKEGVDGLKTGYTGDSGYCLTATMKKENMRVIV